MITIGRVVAITRYPVKSMAGVPADSAMLGWHGLAGDRRFAFRRIGNESGFPWLSASKFPELILYRPLGIGSGASEPLPTHVLRPEGREYELRDPALAQEISERSGMPVELMHLRHGIFDDAPISVISTSTIDGIGDAVGTHLDRRRFRANVVIETPDGLPFLEDDWIGGTLVFGDESAPAVNVALRDPRCVMINLDPETAEQDPRVLKKVVELNANNAGIYGTVTRQGTLHVGQSVNLVPGDP